MLDVLYEFLFPIFLGSLTEFLENPSKAALIGAYCLEEHGEEFLSFSIFFNALTLSRHVHAI